MKRTLIALPVVLLLLLSTGAWASEDEDAESTGESFYLQKMLDMPFDHRQEA